MTFADGDAAAGREGNAAVDAVLRDLREAADRWEALVAEAETITYAVDLGDLRAVINADGRLLDLVLAAGTVTEYTHDELSERLNTAFAVLREEARADNAARYGSELR